MEDKQAFVKKLNEAFIAGDPDRYAHLAEHPVTYVRRGSEEFISRQGSARCVCVTGNSCKAIAEEFVRNFV